MMKVAVFSLKTSLNSKERHLHFGPRKKQKNFRIPKKNEQGKGWLYYCVYPCESSEFLPLQPAVHAHVVVLFFFAELLQTQPLDSREVAELLRQVSQSFRFQNSASMFKFEKVEIVNNDDLRQKVNCCPCIICASVLTFQLCYIWPLKSGLNSSIIILFILACR